MDKQERGRHANIAPPHLAAYGKGIHHLDHNSLNRSSLSEKGGRR